MIMINQKHLKKESFARRFVDALSDFLQFSGRETVCIVFFAAVLTFLSTVGFAQAEVDQSSIVIAVHYGFPFENVRIDYTFHAAVVIDHRQRYNMTFMFGTVDVVWLGIFVNLIVYALPSAFVVRVITETKEIIENHRYDRECAREVGST